jgi:hypothetical protein
MLTQQYMRVHYLHTCIYTSRSMRTQARPRKPLLTTKLAVHTHTHTHTQTQERAEQSELRAPTCVRGQHESSSTHTYAYIYIYICMHTYESMVAAIKSATSSTHTYAHAHTNAGERRAIRTRVAHVRPRSAPDIRMGHERRQWSLQSTQTCTRGTSTRSHGHTTRPTH